MAPSRRAGLAEVGFVLIVFTLITVAAAFQQEARWRPVLEGDALQYYEMTRQFDAGLPFVRATGPFVYRIGVPWLASFASLPQIQAYLPFYLLNIASALAFALLLMVWLRRFVGSSFVRVLMVALSVASWHGPARFVYFYPVYVDPVFLVGMMAALLLMEVAPRRSPPLRAALLLSVIFLGTLVRESMAIVALAAVVSPLLARGRSRGLTVLWRLSPIFSTVAAIAVTRRVGFPSAPYSPLTEPLAMLEHKPIFTWVLGWMFAFGPPVVALIVADLRHLGDVFVRRPHLTIFFAGCLGASFFGGTDTERIAAWAAPIVYALAGRAIERFRAAVGGMPLATTLAAAQAISARIFWPIPSVAYNVEPFTWSGRWQDAYEAFNRLVVIHTHYTYLWSYFGSRAWHAALLAYDVAFVAVVVYWIRLKDRQASAV